MEIRRYVILGGVVFATSLSLTSHSPGQTLATGSGVGIVPSAAPAGEAPREDPVRPLTASQGLSGVSVLPGSTSPSASAPGLPQVFAPTRPRTRYTRYPWKRNIVATVFWIGEKPTPNNPTPNNMSAWDRQWEQNFGGYDNPDSDDRDGYRPKDFVPGQNPFYIALPYNDLQSGGGTKTSARHVVPWFDREFERPGKTIIKGRWVAIRRGSEVCYAQWEDVGPFETDDWQYIFGDARPKAKGNGGAGLDVSPAVRDHLGMSTRGVCDWRFVDEEEVPDGPWKWWGANNPFARNSGGEAGSGSATDPDRIVKLRGMAEEFLGDLPTGAASSSASGESTVGDGRGGD